MIGLSLLAKRTFLIASFVTRLLLRCRFIVEVTPVIVLVLVRLGLLLDGFVLTLVIVLVRLVLLLDGFVLVLVLVLVRLGLLLDGFVLVLVLVLVLVRLGLLLDGFVLVLVLVLVRLGLLLDGFVLVLVLVLVRLGLLLDGFVLVLVLVIVLPSLKEGLLQILIGRLNQDLIKAMDLLKVVLIILLTPRLEVDRLNLKVGEPPERLLDEAHLQSQPILQEEELVPPIILIRIPDPRIKGLAKEVVRYVPNLNTLVPLPQTDDIEELTLLWRQIFDELLILLPTLLHQG